MFGTYGFVQFSSSIIEVFLRLYLVVYFTTIVGMSGEQAGIIVSSSLIVSALFAPLIGSFADQFRRKFGSVIPLINTALVIISITILILFVPEWKSTERWSLFFLCLIYQTSYSLFLIPYFSFAKELIKSENDIISLHSWRYFWGSLGAILGVSLPYLQKYTDNKTYLPFGIFMALMCIISGPTALKFINKIPKKLSTYISIKKKPREDLSNLLNTLPFRYFLLFYIFTSIGLGLNQTLAVFYYKNSLMLNSSETSQLLGIYMFFFCLAILFWTIISKKIGLKKSLVLGVGGTFLCILSYPFIPARDFPIIYIVFIFVGIFSSFFVLVDSYLSRIIDYHSFKNREKKSSYIFGVWKIADKLSRSFGIYLSGIILDMMIYNKLPNYLGMNFKQTFTLALVVFYLPAFIILLKIKYNERHHGIIINFLKKKSSDLLYSQTKD